MDIKELTSKMIEKAKRAATAEELMELAKANGLSLSGEEASTAFVKLHPNGELADNELENVSGGKKIKIDKIMPKKLYGHSDGTCH